MKKFFTLALIFLVFMSIFSQAEATVVKGYAPIMNGDIRRAKEDAKKQALRELVEQVVGVKIQSSVEVSMNMLVSDEIFKKSEGYVTINKIIKEENRGDIFYIELDATASADRIKSTAEDLKSRLDANVNSSDMRGGIVTAIIQKENGIYSYDSTFGRYVNSRLKLSGLKALANDELTEYLVKNYNDPNVDLKARALARDSEDRSGNAFLRGTLSVESVQATVDSKYEALVRASFELIGFETNDIDVFDKYFKAIGSTQDEAIRQAKENATAEAMDSLAKQALETVQTQAQTEGGIFETTLVFDQLTDMSTQLPKIQEALQKLNCSVVRSNIPNGTKAIFLVTTFSYRDNAGLLTALMKELPGFNPPGESGLGVSKMKLLFKG